VPHLLIVSVCFKFEQAGKSENEEIELLVKRLKKIRRGDSYTLLESNGMAWLGNYLTGKYYTYWGSLTTPPCNEVVTWIVLENAVEIGYRQVINFAYPKLYWL
jgi:carbonic anhydrase